MQVVRWWSMKKKKSWREYRLVVKSFKMQLSAKHWIFPLSCFHRSVSEHAHIERSAFENCRLSPNLPIYGQMANWQKRHRYIDTRHTHTKCNLTWERLRWDSHFRWRPSVLSRSSKRTTRSYQSSKPGNTAETKITRSSVLNKKCGYIELGRRGGVVLWLGCWLWAQKVPCSTLKYLSHSNLLAYFRKLKKHVLLCIWKWIE